MLVILSGPSGVNKSYLCWEVEADFPNFCIPKKHTTRKRRPGENDKEYFFVSEDEFDRLRKAGRFEISTKIYGNHYGLIAEELEETKSGHKSAIFVLDVFLAQEQRQRLPNAVLVYIMPVSREDLSAYIIDRAAKYQESPVERLSLLNEELEQMSNFDYVIPCLNSEIAYQFLRNIIIAEGCRPRSYAPEMDQKHFLQFRSFPRLAVDVVILNQQKTSVALIERWKEPHGWALPGGFVMYGESVEQAAKREAFEETGLMPIELEMVDVFSDPSRDPRMHVVSIAYKTYAESVGAAGGDAKNVKWFQLSGLPVNMVFDHRQIIERALYNRDQKGRD